MCDRYACFRSAGALARQFGTICQPPNVIPSWNVVPEHDAPVVRRHPKTGERHLGVLRWGLARDTRNTRNRPYNFRVEEVLEEDSSLSALAQRRCLVPVDAFYVWHKLPSGKKPFAVRRRDKETMALAGLWYAVPDPLLDEPQRTFAILTIPASGVMDTLNDRMPVVLEQADWPLWLGEVAGDPLSLLRGQVGPDLWAWQVSAKALYQDKTPQPVKVTPDLYVGVGRYRPFSRPAPEYPPLPPPDGEELLAVDEVKPGDPFICFRLAGRAVGWSRSRLETMCQRYSVPVGARPPTQPELAFQRTAEELAGRLLETERLCARLALQNAAPADTLKDPVRSAFGYAQDLVRSEDGLVEIGQIVHTWPFCANAGLPWPDPESAAALYRDGDGAYRGAWHGQREYGGREYGGQVYTELASIVSGRLRSLSLEGLIGDHGLNRAAERLAWLADITVTGLEITASTAPEALGRTACA
jgi:putative SOS response-associated peptidase YedK